MKKTNIKHGWSFNGIRINIEFEQNMYNVGKDETDRTMKRWASNMVDEWNQLYKAKAAALKISPPIVRANGD